MAKEHKHAPREVRGVVHELGRLVDDLGLSEDAAPASPAEMPAVDETAAPDGAATPDEAAAAVEPLDAVPMWESAAPEPTPAAAGAAPGLWETFAPELSAKPGRLWSPAAAMVVLEPAAPAGRQAPARRAPARVPLRQRRPHSFTVVTAVAALVAVAVFTFSRLDLGRTSGPAQAVTHPSFAVDTLRPVAATSAAQVHAAKSVQSFPATAQAISFDVVYHNATAKDALQIVILLEPQQAGEQVVTVSDVTHTGLPSSGEMAITVPAPPGGFTPGSYEVRALDDGHIEQSASFAVEQP